MKHRTKKELLDFYRDLSQEIESLEYGQTVDLCFPSPYGRWTTSLDDSVSVYRDSDCFTVNDYIIVPIKMVIKNVFQVLVY